MTEVKTLNEDNFDVEVAQSSTPAVVDFYADWCGPCRFVSPIIAQLAGEFAGKIQVFKLNVDENPSLAERFGVMSIPTVIYFKDGAEQDRMIGAAHLQHYKQKVETLLGNGQGNPKHTA
jgi:thioredoxin 1